MKMHVVSAFSLIELMVVIAVVAILAAVSVPSYRDYITRTRVASVLPIMESYKQRSIVYFNLNNNFAIAEDLNMGTADAVDNPTSSSPYTTLQIIDREVGACKVGSIAFYMSGDALGLSNANDFFLGQIFGESNGIVVSECIYIPVGAEEPDDFLPANCTTNMDGLTSQDVGAQLGVDGC